LRSRKDDNRRGEHEHSAFTFLGFKFCRRTVRTKRGVLFNGFAPGISPQALKAISQRVRRWRLHRCTRLELDDLADWINPIVRGWINYYGRFYRSLLIPLLKRINAYLVRWARKKYRRLALFKACLPVVVRARRPTARPVRPLARDEHVLLESMTRAV